MSISELLKTSLNTSILEPYGHSGMGCISQGEGFMTDSGPIFVKRNRKPEAKRMFNGEMASLLALHATGTIRVPKPIMVVDDSLGEVFFVAEHLNMKGDESRFSSELGTQLARLHMHNGQMLKVAKSRESWVTRNEQNPIGIDLFGFDAVTCCGYIAQVNAWNPDWQNFFVRNRLKLQFDLLLERYGDREMLQLWPHLERSIPMVFKGILPIVPSLLHGDLWSGNVAEIDTEPVIFDPASFYGHHEFELGISLMLGGFQPAFYESYHQLIPKTAGFERRVRLYSLFHSLNHWNHFGDSYKSATISLVRNLLMEMKN